MAEREVPVASCRDAWAVQADAPEIERLASNRIAETLGEARLWWSAIGMAGGATHYVPAIEAEKARAALRRAEASGYIPKGCVWPQEPDALA